MSALRLTLRTLLRTPGLTLVVILSVAAGIGANTAIFSFLGATVFHPLPAVPNDVLTMQVEQGGRMSGASWLEYRDVRERLAPLADISAQHIRSLYIEEGGRTERIWSEFVSDNFFSVLGVRPVVGRFFRTDEGTTPGSAPVAVISHDLWQTRFASSPEVIGQTLRLNRHAFTIIGVTPPKFQGGMMALSFDVWVPLTMLGTLAADPLPLTERAYRATQLDAVLRPGVSAREVQDQLTLTARSLAADFPDSNREVTFKLTPIWRGTRSGVVLMPVYAILQTFALLILGVVCINTANLLLARATVRRREIGIRLAVGAGPGRIIRQLLAESLLLAFAGTALGILAAFWGVDAIHYLKMPTSIPVRLEPVFDTAALLTAIGLGTACGILFGLAPALQLARLDVLPSLRSGNGAITGRNRLRDLLIAAEVGVALVSLVLAGLFYRSFQNAQAAPSGYDADRVLLASVNLAGGTYTPERRAEFVRQLLPRLAAHPQLEAAAIAYKVPLELHGMPKTTVHIDGVKPLADAAPRAIWSPASPGYFAAMGIPFVAGTDFAPLERSDRPLDIVINETAARTFWPDLSPSNGSGRSPLGHTLFFYNKTFTVVGVVRDAKYESLGEAPFPAVWPTLRMGVMDAPNFYLRPRAGDPLAFFPALRDLVREIDPALTVYEGRTLAQHIDNNLAIQRVCANFLSGLAPLALLLAAIGLYAVLDYAIAQRTQEIGVRLALGATPRGVVLHILRQGMRVVVIGGTLGWLTAFALGWYLRPRLVGISLGEPAIYLAIPLLLLAVAFVACWLPARRAAQVDPIIALRAE